MSDDDKVDQVCRRLDNVLECGTCIQERITEGKWDRFATTYQQEIEAMCHKHLVESEKLLRSSGSLEWEAAADELLVEIKKRGGVS